ncbi:MAG: PaaI family thioesterase, partial [Alphaproteobacteria bacterium]|nr:PaaI family thioesterase [Alphaproteobacteria bacterium]
MDIGKRIIGNQPFPTLMGVDVVSAEPAKVVAKLVVRPDLCTAGHIMHGGAIMAFADALGAAGAVMNMPREANTT